MKFIESITSSSWAAGFKHVTCAYGSCSRWLTQRHLETHKVGVTFDSEWYCSYKCLAPVIERALRKLAAPLGSEERHSFRMPVGLSLVSKGRLSSAQLRAANALHKEKGGDLGDVLLDLGYVDEKLLTAARAAQWGCPVFEVPASFAPVGLQLPTNMVKNYGMVLLEYSQRSQKASIGFLERVEYGALYAAEQIIGCKAQPYLITPSDFDRCVAATPVRGGIDEQVFDIVQKPADMRHILCSFGAEIDAEDVHLARCGRQIWARLRYGLKTADTLFRVA